MFRFLFVADDAEALRGQAPGLGPTGPLARLARPTPWRGALPRCERCAGRFSQAFDPLWSAEGLKLWDFGSASRRFREFVEQRGYDVVQVVTPGPSRFVLDAMRPLRGMKFPRVITGALDAQEAGAEHLTAETPVRAVKTWDHVYAHALDLGPPRRSQGRWGRARWLLGSP